MRTLSLIWTGIVCGALGIATYLIARSLPEHFLAQLAAAVLLLGLIAAALDALFGDREG